MRNPKRSRASLSDDLDQKSAPRTEKILSELRDLEMMNARSFAKSHPEWSAMHAKHARQYQHDILSIRREAKLAKLDELMGDEPISQSTYTDAAEWPLET